MGSLENLNLTMHYEIYNKELEHVFKDKVLGHNFFSAKVKRPTLIVSTTSVHLYKRFDLALIQPRLVYAQFLSLKKLIDVFIYLYKIQVCLCFCLCFCLSMFLCFCLLPFFSQTDCPIALKFGM